MKYIKNSYLANEIINERLNISDILKDYYGVNIPNNKDKVSISCPIHNGKHKNFLIDKRRNIATCFSKCAKTYNILSLMYEYFNSKDYVRVVEELNKRYYLGLEYLIIEEEEKEVIKENSLFLDYDNFISEKILEIEKNIYENKSNFMNAPTGGGKTYLITELMKRNEEAFHILLTPSVMQNLQNAKDYKIQSYTGNDNIIKSNMISATYEKAENILKRCNELKEKYKEIILYIDECHLLIDFAGFRDKGIKGIENLIKVVDRVVYTTATPHHFKQIYEYDKEIILKPKNPKNNYELMFHKKFSEDIPTRLSQLIELIKRDIKTGQQVILHWNDKESIKDFISILEKDTFFTGIIDKLTSEDKQNSITYKNIVENSIIPKDVKLLLCTSVLEVGTNIKNTNMSVIFYINKMDHLDFIKIEQFFARVRNKGNNVGYIITVNKEEELKNIATENELKADILRSCKNSIEDIELYKKYSYLKEDEDKEKLKKDLIAHLENKYIKSLSYGVIELNENNDILINENKLQKKVKCLYDRQFYRRHKKLMKKIKATVKAEIYMDSIVESCNTSIKNIVLEANKDNIKNKENEKEELMQIVKKIKDNNYIELLIQKIEDEDIILTTDLEDIYKNIKDTYIYKGIKKGTKLLIPNNIIINIIYECNSTYKINNALHYEQYKQWNKKYPLGDTKYNLIPDKGYSYLRNKLDKNIKSRITVSQKILKDIVIDLIKLKVIKGYYIDGKLIIDNKKNTSILPKTIQRIALSNIEEIYKVSNHKNGIQINSLN